MAAKRKTASKAKAPARSKPVKRSNVDTLQEAGVLQGEHASAAHKAAINKLSKQEVQALVRVHKKTAKYLNEPSPTGAAASRAGCPWML